MQDVIFYVAANQTLGKVKDFENAVHVAPPVLVRGVPVRLRMRLFLSMDGDVVYPVSSFDDIVSWSFCLDSDYDALTKFKLSAENQAISVASVTEEIDGVEHTYTEIRIPITDTETPELVNYIGTRESVSLNGELVGYNSEGISVFVLQIKRIKVRNRITYEPDTTPPVITLAGDTTSTTATTFTVGLNEPGTMKYNKIASDAPEENWVILNGTTATLNADEPGTWYFFAQDISGNTSTAIITFPDIEVVGETTSEPTDTTAPVVTITSSVPDNEWAEFVTLTITTDEAVVSIVYNTVGENYSGSWTSYNASTGIRVTRNATYWVQATDASGNVGKAKKTVLNVDFSIPDVIAYVNGIPTREIFSTPVEAATISFVATDTQSRVKRIIVSQREPQSTDFVTWNNEPIVTTTNSVWWYGAYDNAGNYSGKRTLYITGIPSVIPDTTPPDPPVISASITTATEGDVVLTATAEEDASIYVRVDSGTWSPYPVGGVTATSNGVYEFYAEDVAGNTSTVAGYTVSNIIDPNAEPFISGFTSSPSTPTSGDVTVYAEPGGTAVRIEYKLPVNSYWTEYYPQYGVTVSDNWTIRFRGVDENGNAGAESAFAVTNIDTTAPVITLNYNNTTPAKYKVITASVNETATLYYKKTGDNEWIDYDTIRGTTATANGTYQFMAVDRAGNRGYGSANITTIDTTPPATPDATYETDEETGDVTVTPIFSTDSVTKQYSLNNVNWFSYVTPIRFTSNGTVYFRSFDAAGNQSETLVCNVVVGIDTNGNPTAGGDDTGVPQV